MNPPELPAKASRSELRKALLRMRLEMHRQELRHETLRLLQPLHQAQDLGRQWRETLGGSNAPLWAAGGALLLATLGMRRSHWRRWLRIALLAFPLLRRRPPRAPARAQSEHD
ncbi:hypothetical protein [Pseudomonas benzenivorans]|uniref:hypothetical protein n=1 Tax=Pseudomonas benzenivorans TaxID=556533 RepID=UPI003519C452